MKKESGKRMTRRLIRSYLTSVASISLVLLLLAAALFVMANTKSLTDYFKENSAVSVILKSDATQADALDLQQIIEKLGFVRKVTLISREQGEKEMEELLGKDFLKVFASSPIPISLEVNLQSGYFDTDSLVAVRAAIMKNNAVREVSYQESLVEAMSSNLDKIAIAATAVIALLLVISVALIANTVRLNIFARRFTIHTMRLVGARRSFIRRPFIRQAFWQGAVSGLIACGCFSLLLYYLKGYAGDMSGFFSGELIIPIFATVMAAGILICIITTAFQVNRLADISKDDLYI